ncbi:MAG TPA: MgtC/SapB family protein [Pyrinomonadaceae bacterium]|jgi:putative Mg2+ transporter-C (MgtC) family protein|nr:MgtC/SapB family protein [Pyrinomonadaceae bacterium]
MSYDSPLVGIGIKLLVAMLCSGAIGLERELSRKPAGLRTNVLIGMGASLFMITSREISGGVAYTDPARLVAQVVSGIGFIGAGVILQSRGSVIGLTTAATIFVVTAVGIAIGEGMFGPAILATVLIIFVLVLLRHAERAILLRRRMYRYTFKTHDPASTLARLLDLLEKEGLRLEDFDVRETSVGEHEVGVSVVTSLSGNRRLIEILPQLGKDLHAATHE